MVVVVTRADSDDCMMAFFDFRRAARQSVVGTLSEGPTLHGVLPVVLQHTYGVLHVPDSPGSSTASLLVCLQTNVPQHACLFCSLSKSHV